MAKGKGKKKLNKGKNPLKISKIKLTPKPKKAYPPIKCKYRGVVYPSITAAAKATGERRTNVNKHVEKL